MTHRNTGTNPGSREGESPATADEPTLSTDVRLWKVSKVSSKRAPYQLRWVVAGKVCYSSFATSALADSRRSELWRAMRKGEAFDVDSGLPESELRAAAAAEAEMPAAKADPSWWEFAQEYMKRSWRTAAAKTREGLADGLAVGALGMTRKSSAMPEPRDVRRAVRWAVVPAHEGEEPPPDLAKTCEWLAANSLPLSALTDSDVAEDVHYWLSYKLDGKPAATATYKRRRRDFNTAIEYAIQKGYLEKNPIAGLKRPTTGGSAVVDPRALMNGIQGRQFLVAVSYVGTMRRNRGRRLVAFFACMLYAAMRPAEVVGLRLDDCHLPEAGWGVLTLRATLPVSGKQWTDSGKPHDSRGLKAREPGVERPVPIPPVLVAILRAHLKEFGTAKDGRLFQNERGGLVGASCYWRVWHEARPYAFPPRKVASPLARKPYDARATCITDWLRSGLPVAEVARRAGNSPDVIHRHYAGVVDDSEEENNRKIEKTMGWEPPDAA